MTPAESRAKGKQRAELDAWQPEQAGQDAGLGSVTSQEEKPIAAAHTKSEPDPSESLGERSQRLAIDETDQHRRLFDVEDEVLTVRDETTAADAELDLDVGKDVQHGRSYLPRSEVRIRTAPFSFHLA